jgi:hypothetical protein
VIADFNERIREYPGDRSELDWLDTFECLRSCLSQALSTYVQLGCYWIDDFPGFASAGGSARIRGHHAVPGIDSDYWEGILCWSGNRGMSGYAGALIFPFLRGSAVVRRGRIADLGPGQEVDENVYYRFENGTFINSGWSYADGPGEWASVTTPGTVYLQCLNVIPPARIIGEHSQIAVDLQIPQLSSILAHSERESAARISLVHVNRNHESTNVVPWTSQPPQRGSRDVQTVADCSFPTHDVLRVRLDSFRIRGGWMPGKYHLSIRIQNFHKLTDWAWSCDISEPFKLTIVPSDP